MLNYNQTTLDAFNQYPKSGAGTLIANWWEERQLRETTGVTRTVPNVHLAQTHKDLFLKPPNEISNITNGRQVDNTNQRTLGEKQVDFPQTQNSVYGKGQNKANQLPNIGPQQQLIQNQYFDVIKDEIENQEKFQNELRNARTFQTTTQVQFGFKSSSLEGHTLGRRVMRTQNGQPLSSNAQDEDLMVDKGLVQRQNNMTDQQLKELIPKESYLTQQPVTFWTDKTNDGCFYLSKPGGDKTHYTHVKK